MILPSGTLVEALLMDVVIGNATPLLSALKSKPSVFVIL